MLKTMVFLCVCVAVVLSTLVFGNEKPLVAVTILPQKYFVERIAGETLRVIAIIAAGKSPHDYALSPMEMANLSASRAWFTLGLPLEKVLLEKFSSQNTKIIPTQNGVEFLPMSDDEQHQNCAHNNEGMDPHIWLDPQRAQIICQNILDGLCAVFPEQQTLYQQNAATLIADLQKLDGDLQKTLQSLRGKKIIVFHPAFGYFCARYGLQQIPIEHNGKMPNAIWLSKVIAIAKNENIKVIFTQPQFTQGVAQTAAHNIDGVVLPFDALPENYFDELQKIANIIATQ